MGISVDLKVNFHGITEKQWVDVYEESLTLLQGYPFMDKIVDEASYGSKWIYAERSRERYLTPWMPEERGWYTIGDMVTHQDAENFVLLRNYHYYCMEPVLEQGDTGDPLLTLPALFSLDCELPEVSSQSVFGGKTQGYDYHKYILGIACLVEDRLKPYAVVDGDITRAQVKASLEWVNSLLEAPVSLPDRCVPEKLLERIQPVKAKGAEGLDLFLSLNMAPLNPDLGQFLQSCFDTQTIKAYWKKRMGQNIVGTVGMGWVLRDYLNLGNPLEWLREVYPLPDDDCEDDPDTAVKKLTTRLLEMGIADSDRLGDVTEVSNSENPEPETVWSMLEKFTWTMKGVPSQLSITMKEETFREKMIQTFQRKELIEAAIDGFNEEMRLAEEQQGDKIRSIISRIESEAEGEGYEIGTFDDLILWEDDKSIDPGLVRALEGLYEGCAAQVPKIRDVFSQGAVPDSLKGRMKFLIYNNRKFLISKEAWDFIRSKIAQDEHYYLLLSLLFIKEEELTIVTILKAVFNNTALLNHFFLEKQAGA